MSKLNDSLLLGSSGRTGRLVVANVNGTEILRVRARKSTKPVSPKQELIWTRMKTYYAFLESYKNYASAFFGVRVGLNPLIITQWQAFSMLSNLTILLWNSRSNIPKFSFQKGSYRCCCYRDRINSA